MQETLQRWGGILIRPRVTLEALASSPPAVGKWDGWLLAVVFVVGSQVERLTATVARFELFQSYWLLLNGLALALLTPLLVSFLTEGVVGAKRARYRHLPLAALVAASTVGKLLAQLGVELPGPTFIAEIVGTVWAGGLAVWIRRKMPELEPEPELNT